MTFDPENTIDPLRRGFHALESLNEENLGPRMSLSPRPRHAIEIIIYVHDGTLIHQNGAGGRGHLGPGEFQRTSSNAGARHCALSGSRVEPARVFQSCITSRHGGMRVLQEQKRFTLADREGILRVVASPDGGRASLSIDQDVRLYSSILLPGHHLIHELDPGRGAWLQGVDGGGLLGDHRLCTGDGAGPRAGAGGLLHRPGILRDPSL